MKGNTTPYAVVEKEIGKTPLEALLDLKVKLNLPPDTPLAYAGRLDPMAEGKLLLLIGDECKNQADYFKLDKTYHFGITFGLSTDTHDILGLAQACTPIVSSRKSDLDQLCAELIGNIGLPYPHYSSKTVAGKPLFLWTLENRLDEIVVPTNTTNIYSLTCDHLSTISTSSYLKYIKERINLLTEVTADSKKLGNNFRKEEIIERWSELLLNSNKELMQASFTCICSSGTYMRSLAHYLANQIGSCGHASFIKRTEIGIFDATEQTWTKTF